MNQMELITLIFWDTIPTFVRVWKYDPNVNLPVFIVNKALMLTYLLVSMILNSFTTLFVPITYGYSHETIPFGR